MDGRTYSVYFVESLPSFLRDVQTRDCLDGSFQPGCPYPQSVHVLFVDVVGQGVCVLSSSLAQVRVATNSAQ